MKYCQLILLICMIASCHSTPKVIPKAGEIWRNYDDKYFNQGDVSIDSVDSGHVYYTFLRTPKGALPNSLCDIKGFMQNSFKIKDAGQGAVYDENGIVILDSAKKVKAVSDSVGNFWESAEIGHPDSADSIIVVESQGRITAITENRYTKRQLDSAYRKGLNDGRKECLDFVNKPYPEPIGNITITSEEDTLELIKCDTSRVFKSTEAMDSFYRKKLGIDK